MRKIAAKKIRDSVARLCVQANVELREDVLAALKAAVRRETSSRARKILQAIIENAAVARRERLAICQDTGMPMVFVELGQEVRITGDLQQAIQQGVARGYRKAYLRNSIIKDPLARGKPGAYPCVVHIDVVRGNRLKLKLLPKGFGCENKSQLKMFLPTAKLEEIKRFVIEAVKSAGPDACPPYVVGVGIGGTADYAALLAKKALLKSINRPTLPVRQAGGQPANRQTTLEWALLSSINKLNIGPMGLGGKTTALAVNSMMYPTHIAGLPVAVNISCHALRSAQTVL